RRRRSPTGARRCQAHSAVALLAVVSLRAAEAFGLGASLAVRGGHGALRRGALQGPVLGGGAAAPAAAGPHGGVPAAAVLSGLVCGLVAAAPAAAARRGAATSRRGAPSTVLDAASDVAAPQAEQKGKTKGKGAAGIDLEPPSGTRDFFPEDMRLQRWLFDKFRGTAAQFSFQEYDAPVLENEDLYKRKAGEEITEQMYNFKDKEGNAVTLRPEMTPSLARMVLSLMRAETGAIAAVLPLKWYSLPQCWRFETTQRGRRREHYQWNMDIVGVPGITAEAELLAAVVHFFESVGITSQDVGLKVNSRKVLGAVLETAGVPDSSFAETCVIIDKLDKIGAEDVQKLLVQNVGLSAEVSERIVQATTAQTLEEFAELAGVGDSDEVKELRRLFELAEDYGYADWLQFDASVVRGLAYYTGVVFEGFDKAGKLRAICGGGRYDKLLGLYGSKKEVPCVGFGFGDCVIVELLKEKNVLPQLEYKVDYVVAAFNDSMMGKAMSVAARLRKAGKTVDLFTDAAKKVKKAFKYADRVGGRRIAFVAPDEWENGMVRIKDLRAHEETLKQLFRKMDADGNHAVTKVEAQQFFKGAFAKVSANAMFNEVDSDKSDTITEDEFVAFWRQVVHSGYKVEEVMEEVESMLTSGSSWVDFKDDRNVGGDKAR
ncbi:unnamed protein product, partial [Prorocentrum cordatum]